MGWIGNVFIIIGLYLVGNKSIHAFTFSMIGEALWTVQAGINGQYDLAVICVVFFLMAARNALKWRAEAVS